MSTVDSNQSLNNILDKLGIQPQEQKKRADGGALGQEDFLKLMKCFPLLLVVLQKL